jgi:DNA-binding transcriptional LysR family regulator
MDLRHLRYFICVAQEMHFGRAAARLGISQPPLSQQIRALEAELGVRLFDRTSRRVRLTQAGILFLPEAQETLDQADRAMQIARRAQRGEIGRLGLGFTTSAPFVLQIARALYAFRQDQPDVELTLVELPRDAQIAKVEQGQLDLGIVRGFEAPVLPPSLASICLLEEDLILAMRSDHPLAARAGEIGIADLAETRLVLYDSTNGAGFNEHLIALCHAAGFSPRVAQEAGGLATLLGLVAAGFGVTVLARSLARLHLADLVYRRLDEPEAVSRLWLIHGGDMSAPSRAFLKSVVGCVADMPQT